jgi:hypothetical protein
MWIVPLTHLATALAFVTTAAYVITFLIASQGWLPVGWLAQWGLPLMTLPLTLIIAAHLLRRGAGLLLLRRGLLDPARRYCLPRAHTSPTVGRNEAAFNRYVAAEANRRLGDPHAALRLLDEPLARPWRADTRQLLAISRGLSLADLGRLDDARLVLAALDQAPLASAAHDAAKALRERLSHHP